MLESASQVSPRSAPRISLDRTGTTVRASFGQILSTTAVRESAARPRQRRRARCRRLRPDDRHGRGAVAAGAADGRGGRRSIRCSVAWCGWTSRIGAAGCATSPIPTCFSARPSSFRTASRAGWASGIDIRLDVPRRPWLVGLRQLWQFTSGAGRADHRRSLPRGRGRRDRRRASGSRRITISGTPARPASRSSPEARAWRSTVDTRAALRSRSATTIWTNWKSGPAQSSWTSSAAASTRARPWTSCLSQRLRRLGRSGRERFGWPMLNAHRRGVGLQLRQSVQRHALRTGRTVQVGLRAASITTKSTKRSKLTKNLFESFGSSILRASC